MKSTPGQDLVDILEQIRIFPSTPPPLKNRLNNSGVERTAGLGFQLGKHCDYYKKSLTKFLCDDYMDIRNLLTSLEEQKDDILKVMIEKAITLIKIVEGP